MKLNLKSTNKKEITTLREQLAAALETISASAAEAARLIERQTKLQDEITALENVADDMADDAAAKLATKRLQLDQVGKKIQTLNSVPVAVEVGEQVAISALLKQFARTACAATWPDLKAYIEREIVSKIRPWCLNDDNALALACELPHVKSLTQTYARPFGSYGVTVPEIQQAIARADEILSGDLLWTLPAGK